MVSESQCLRLTLADVDRVAGKAGLRPGLPPRWNDWREGRFLERPAFAELRRAFDEWRDQVTSAPGNATPVFCLCGRDGDGKSVLLLQLAAAMFRDHAIDALRLWEAGDDPRRFETSPPNDAHWHFVDRLPELIHGKSGETWLRLLREQRPCFVVTTATPDTLDGFVRKYPKRFTVTVWHLPLLSPTEAASLAAMIGNGAGSNVWCEGMTRETFLFACGQGAPLEHSLESLGIELLPIVCAANLLGLAAPASLLKPEKRSVAQQLADEGHLPVHLSAAGLHLLTPGLAQSVFDRCYPEVETRVLRLAEGFAQLLEIWLRENNTVAASWFLRRLLHSEHWSRVLPARQHPRALRDLRKDLLRELYERHRSRHEECPATSLLSAWMEIGQTFRLRPDVMEDADHILERAPDSVSPALAADIWHYSEYRKNPLAARLRQGLATYFKNTKADSGAALARLYADTHQNEAALPVLQHWLEAHPLHPRFADVFGALLEKGFATSRIQAWAQQCLGWHWRGKAAGRPLALLLQHNPNSPALRQRARHWLAKGAEQHSEAGPVLAALLENGGGEKAEIHAALLWTAEFPVQPATGRLWESLLKHHADRSEVRQVALEWIKACPQHSQAAAMLLAVARREKNNSDMATIVRRWLETQPTPEQAPVVLETLAASTDESIRHLVAEWLDGHPQHPSAARVLAAALCAGKGGGWMQRAETFLRSGHPDALRVLRVLLASSASEGVLKLVWEVLPKSSVPEQKRLSRWLGALAGQQPERAGVLRAGLPGGSELVEEYFSALCETLGDMRAVTLAEWTRRGFAALDDGDQQQVFRLLLAQDSPLPAPFSAALAAWLQRNFKQPAYRQMRAVLQQHPKQGHLFRSASLLPLNILADVAAH